MAALDLVSGRRMIFAGGSLVDAVYASSAIPGLFEPLHLEGHVLAAEAALPEIAAVLERHRSLFVRAYEPSA